MAFDEFAKKTAGLVFGGLFPEQHDILACGKVAGAGVALGADGLERLVADELDNALVGLVGVGHDVQPDGRLAVVYRVLPGRCAVGPLDGDLLFRKCYRRFVVGPGRFPRP